jgi:hypothetical protein
MTDDFVSRRTIEVKNQIPDLPLAGINVAVDARYLREPGMGIHSYLKAGIELLLDEGADVTLLANFPGEGLVKSLDGRNSEVDGILYGNNLICRDSSESDHLTFIGLLQIMVRPGDP